MKRMIGICIVTTISLLNVSFSNPTDEWGDWSVVSYNYEGIEARVKKGDFNSYANKYYWYIQFRNRYTNRAQFNYDFKARSERDDCNPNKRKDLESGETSDVTGSLISDDYKVHVCIGDVEIGE